MIIILIAIILTLIVLNILLAKGKLRKVIIATNIIIVMFPLLTGALYLIDKKVTELNSRDYDIYSGTVLSDYSYGGEIDDYYIIHSSGLFYSDTIAIPVRDTYLTPICKYYKSVKLYMRQGTNIVYEDRIILSSGRGAYYCDDVARIVPDCWPLFFSVLIISSLIFVASNIVYIVLVIIMRIKIKELSDNK